MATTETLPNVFQRWPRRMGKVLADITIENAIDGYLAEAGVRDEVRQLTLSEVLADTGATHLFLPKADIEALGLRQAREVEVETANGFATTFVYEGVRVRIGDRSAVFECLALPHGTKPLLGCQVMEGLGIIPEVLEQKLVFMPERGSGTWVTAYRA